MCSGVNASVLSFKQMYSWVEIISIIFCPRDPNILLRTIIAIQSNP